jgi:hypothetical protein
MAGTVKEGNGGIQRFSGFLPVVSKIEIIDNPTP